VPSQFRADLTPQELNTVLKHYAIGPIRQANKQVKGSRRSPKVILETDGGRYLLKRRARGRDHPMKVTFAHSVQQYLAEQGFPLPRLVTTKDQDTMVIINERIYELFEFSEGDTFDRSLEATFDAGRVLGLFHQLLEGFESDWEPSRRGFHDSSRVRNSLNEIPSSIGKHDSVAGKETELLGTVTSLYDAYEAAAERVNNGKYHKWPVQLVHADWHPGNMLFSDGRVEAVIDYDSLRLMPKVTDASNGALQFSILSGSSDPRQWPPELDEDRLQEFIVGYREENSIPPEQVEYFPWLMIEALIAEAVTPIAATGMFGHVEGFRFMRMITRKVRWLEQHSDRLVELVGE
jgi:homoserine kinase type II